MYSMTNERRKCFSLLLLLAGLLAAMQPTAYAKRYWEYPEWEILPKGVDYEDEAILARFQLLADEGEAGHEAMLAIIKECTEQNFPQRALGVLRDMGGDMTRALAELKPFFAERLPHAQRNDEWLMTDIARFVADYGTEEDVDVLIPMLSHSNLRIRILGARYLGQSGGRQALEALKEAQSGGGDERFLQETDKAIANIESRLSEKDTGHTPSEP